MVRHVQKFSNSRAFRRDIRAAGTGRTVQRSEGVQCTAPHRRILSSTGMHVWQLYAGLIYINPNSRCPRILQDIEFVNSSWTYCTKKIIRFIVGKYSINRLVKGVGL